MHAVIGGSFGNGLRHTSFPKAQWQRVRKVTSRHQEILMNTFNPNWIFVIVAASLVACSGGSGDNRSPDPSVNQSFEVRGDCNFEACGVVPSSLESVSQVSCSTSAGACTWSSSADDSSVSYRPCADSECPSRPSLQCPTGTSQASQTCGSENSAACAWTTTCVPPRVTTPCSDNHGCDNLPLVAMGVICSDGSTGGFACVADGQSCRWERNCD